jgi:hypothetical protein
LTLLDKNAAKGDEVKRRRLAILNLFMERVRKAVAADPSQVDLVIMKQCETQGLTPPSDLAEAMSAATAA